MRWEVESAEVKRRKIYMPSTPKRERRVVDFTIYWHSGYFWFTSPPNRLLTVSTNPPPTDPSNVKVLEIVKAWATKTDAELWKEFFVRVNEDQVSLSDEILFLRTIESISKQVSWIGERCRQKTMRSQFQ